jgi:hypothetical protein
MIKVALISLFLISKLNAQTLDSTHIIYDSLGNEYIQKYYTDTMARTLEEAERLISLYEQNGAAKLFYSLNRKMNEMAEMLNKQSLTSLDLTDPKDKTFERLKVVWNDSASIAIAVKALGDAAGITNDETVDTTKPIFKRITTPESIADHVNELAGKSDN